VGKSYLLETLAEQSGGFYYQAVRGSSAEALRDLGERLGEYQGAAAPLALPDWERGIDALLSLGHEREQVVVLDEFPYLLEHTPALASIIQRALGTRRPSRGDSRARLILCGSAITVMSNLLVGTAPLRGRAGLDLRVSPFD
jgi:AAA+ ATPase superfamily predicted ATPase